jgi:hypothetical protein
MIKTSNHHSIHHGRQGRIKMTVQKIRNKYWIIKNGQPKREATEREVKRFVVLNLIDKLQTV